MKKLLFGFIAFVFTLCVITETSGQITNPPPPPPPPPIGTNPFGFPNPHPGVDPFSLHGVIWRNCTIVCTGNSIVGQVISGYNTCLPTNNKPNCQ